MFQSILAVLLLASTSSVFANDAVQLVYQDQLEIQDINGEHEVYSRYIKEKVRVNRIISQRIEEISESDLKGLRYGFPLNVGMKWDEECDFERSDNMYCKYVEKIEDVTVPAGTFRNCFKIVYRTCPDEETIWYYPGIGVIKYLYYHHGTITNEKSELVKIIRNKR